MPLFSFPSFVLSLACEINEIDLVSKGVDNTPIPCVSLNLPHCTYTSFIKFYLTVVCFFFSFQFVPFTTAFTINIPISINRVPHTRTFCSNSTYQPQQRVCEKNKKGFELSPKQQHPNRPVDAIQSHNTPYRTKP